jgi:hypothetical protein
MAHYLFETNWALTASADAVFDVLAEPGEFAGWWPSVVESALLAEGDETGVGRKASYVIRGPLPYTMRFEVRALEVDRPKRLHTVVRGDLVGTGTYLMEERGDVTHVRFNWYVATTKTWMNALSIVAKPVFAWAHHRVMREGCAAMADLLEAKLVSFDTDLVTRATPVVPAEQPSAGGYH